MRLTRFWNRSYRDYAPSKELLRQLDIIILSAAVGMFLFANTGGAALTGYASAFGAGEFVFGLISALPILASLMQLFVSYLVEKTGQRKRLFLIGGVIQRSAWVLVAFIPLFVPEFAASSRIWVLLTLITLAAMAGSFVGVSHVSMMAEVVPMEIRGRYITTRQRTTTLFSLAAGLGAAFVLDHLPGYWGYTVVFGVGGLCGIADILLYTRFEFPPLPRSEKRFSLFEGAIGCFKDERTRRFLIFWMVWGFGVNLSSTFFGKYAIEMLGLSFTQIILFGQITANLLSFLVLPRWGRFLDRYGAVPLMLFAGTVTSLVTLVWIPSVPGSVLTHLLFHILGGLIWSATDACAANMQLSHTPSLGRPLVLAVYAVTTSLAAALAFVSAGAFLELTRPAMQAANLTILGTPFDHYKLLFLITAVVRLSAVLFFLPRVWNEKGMTTREAYALFFADLKAGLRAMKLGG
jgi:MFS family permease